MSDNKYNMKTYSSNHEGHVNGDTYNKDFIDKDHHLYDSLATAQSQRTSKIHVVYLYFA